VAETSSKKIYQKGFRKYGINYRSLAWKTKDAQMVRFRELLKDLDLDGKSILDFGCGMGDIIPYIMELSDRFEYKGVDIVTEFIDVARRAYITRKQFRKIPQVKFFVRDLLKKPFKEKFDIVLCSGALNSNLNDAVRYRKCAIKILWDHTKEVLAFNMAGAHPQPTNSKNSRIYYTDSLKILKYCMKLTPKVIFRNSYRKKDFTIQMFR